MKKILVLSAIGTLCMIACGKKSVPTTGTAPARTEAAKTETPPPVKTDAETKAELEAKAKVEAAEKPPVTTPVMTEMDNGKMIYTSKCTNCHAMKNTSDYTFSQWQNILRSMVPKAKLNNEEEKQLTAYIKANAKQ